MRIAHVVGLSPDGRSLVVATDSGDELAVAADDRLRDALRGIGARHGRLETPMDSSLSPRDIQARVRAGASLDEVTEAAGMPLERVERFAAPVLAEREHIAAMAVSSSVRRRGETSGHRNLRATAAERLLKRGVDVDSLVWDSHRLEDGRWAVTADYALGDDSQRAIFFFDPRGRYSVAGDDPARWLVGEQPPGTATASPGGGDAPAAADEPTVDLSDELALVRAIQEPASARPTIEVLAEVEHEQTERTVVRALRSVPVPPAAPVEPASAADQADGREEPRDEQSGLEQSDVEQSGSEESEVEQPSGLNVLYAMLDDGSRDGADSAAPRGHAGPSDAAAVPATSTGGWEAAPGVDYPVEPSPEEAEPAAAEPAAAEHPYRSGDPLGSSDHEADGGSEAGEDRGPADLRIRPDEPPATDELPGSEGAAEGAQEVGTAEQFELETEPAPAKATRRKRASVPSWDEIMFGGPKPPG